MGTLTVQFPEPLTYNLSWMAKDTNLIKLKTAAVR